MQLYWISCDLKRRTQQWYVSLHVIKKTPILKHIVASLYLIVFPVNYLLHRATSRKIKSVDTTTRNISGTGVVLVKTSLNHSHSAAWCFGNIVQNYTVDPTQPTQAVSRDLGSAQLNIHVMYHGYDQHNFKLLLWDKQNIQISLQVNCFVQNNPAFVKRKELVKDGYVAGTPLKLRDINNWMMQYNCSIHINIWS